MAGPDAQAVELAARAGHEEAEAGRLDGELRGDKIWVQMMDKYQIQIPSK